MKFQFLKWTARMLSIVSALLIILVAAGGRFSLHYLTAEEKVFTLFFPIGVIAGFAVSWIREGLGGIITIGSLFAFYVSNYICYDSMANGFAFLVFASPGFLFALIGLIRMMNKNEPLFHSG